MSVKYTCQPAKHRMSYSFFSVFIKKINTENPMKTPFNILKTFEFRLVQIMVFALAVASCGGGGAGSGGTVSSQPQSAQKTPGISLLAGDIRNDTGGSSVDGIGAAARFISPGDLAVDKAGNVYVAEPETIRKISPSGVVTTLAGTAGSPGSVDGTGAAARFTYPSGLVIDASGNIYVAETVGYGPGTIRKITPAGVVTTVVRNLDFPSILAIDAVGNFYVNANCGVAKVTSNGVVTPLAGSCKYDNIGNANLTSVDGVGAAANFSFIRAMTIGADGTLYAGDGSLLRKISPSGVVTTLAGSSVAGVADGSGSAARFTKIVGLAPDTSGNIYASDSGHAYFIGGFTELNFTSTVRKITPAGTVTTVAGKAGTNGTVLGDLPGTLDYPIGLGIDSSGTLYLTSWHAILKIQLP